MLKRFLLGLSLAIGVLLLAPAPKADAEGSRGWHHGKRTRTHHVRHHHHRKSKGFGAANRNGFGAADRGGFSTPELDPSAAGGAVILLLGGVAYIASRRREEDLA